MFIILVVLISLLALFLITIILLQSGKGGGLAAEFGGASSSTDSIMGGRQAANVLTRATWIGGALFLALSLSHEAPAQLIHQVEPGLFTCRCVNGVIFYP